MAKILGLSQNTLILLVVLVAGYALYTGMLKLPASTYAPGGSTAASSVDTPPSIAWGQYWVDPSTNNQKTAVAGWMQIFEAGRSTATFSQTANGGNITTSGAVPCGFTGNMVFGDGNVWYYTIKPIGPVDKTVYSVGDTEVVPSGAVTLRVSNATTFEQTAIDIANATYGGSSVGTATINLNLRFPTAAYFGDKYYGICFNFNPANITTVVPYGNLGTLNQVAINGSTTAQMTATKCWKMAKANLGQAIDVPLSIQGAGAGIQTADTIAVTLIDGTTGVFNGMPFEGTDNGPGSGVNTDIGRANVHNAGNYLIRFTG